MRAYLASEPQEQVGLLLVPTANLAARASSLVLAARRTVGRAVCRGTSLGSLEQQSNIFLAMPF